MAIPRRLPGHKGLRARFISFLHRMVEAVGATLLPYLPATLEVGAGVLALGEGGVGGDACTSPCLAGWEERHAKVQENGGSLACA